MRQPRRHRIDEVQQEIVSYIRQRPGWSWLPVRDHGDGLFRAGWWTPGLHLLIEIKNEKGRLRPGQALLAERKQTVVIRSVDDLEDIVNAAGRALDKINVKFTDKEAQ